MYEKVPITFVLADVMRQTGQDGFAIPLGLIASLEVVLSGVEIFYAKKRALFHENFAHELWPVFCDQKTRNPILYEPVVAED